MWAFYLVLVPVSGVLVRMVLALGALIVCQVLPARLHEEDTQWLLRNRNCGVLHSVVTPVPSSEPVVDDQTSDRRGRVNDGYRS